MASHMFGGMDGKGRAGGVLAVASSDPVLSVLGPIGLASVAGTALIVDLDDELHRPRTRSLADMAAEGARLSELAPGRRGVAMVSSGGLSPDLVPELVARLAHHWPAVVIRPGAWRWDGPTVPLIPLYPGWLAPAHIGAAVWQRVPGGVAAPAAGPVLPAPGPAMVRRMLGGGLPGRNRWVRAWGPVWELPWA